MILIPESGELIKREPIREVHEAMDPVSVVLERHPSEAEEKAILQRNEKMIQLCERPEFDGFLKYDARLLIEEKDAKNVELILIPDQPECFGMLIRYDKKNKEFCLCRISFGIIFILCFWRPLTTKMMPSIWQMKLWKANDAYSAPKT